MSAPIMPVRGYTHAIHLGSPWAGMMVIPDGIDTVHGGVSVVVVPIDAVSWSAMVERAMSARDLSEHPNPMTPHRMYVAAERALRRALNLPDGWTP